MGNQLRTYRWFYIAITLVGTLVYGQALGQQKPNFTIEHVNNGSDYFVKLRTTNAAPEMDCWGNDTYSYDVFRNGALFLTQPTAPLGNDNNNRFISVPAGIAKASATWRLTYKTDGDKFNCHYWKNSNTVSASTSALKAPLNFSATDAGSAEALNNQILLKWAAGTDVPVNKRKFKIYRDNGETPIATLNGNILSWTDNNVAQGAVHTYRIVNVVEHPDLGNHVSPEASAEGSTYAGPSASDGTHLAAVEVKWPAMHADAKSVRLFRDNESLTLIEDMQTRTYIDGARVPGVKHRYHLQPYKANDEPFEISLDTGYATLNGVIKGKITAPFGGPIGGATVYAVRTSTIEQGNLHPTVYSATTTASGSFNITGIYYHTNANFRVYAEKGDHIFNPEDYEDIPLTLASPVYDLPAPSFVDISSFTVNGKVFQQLNGAEVPVAGVEILVDGVFRGTTTGDDGNYSLTVDEGGEHTFMARYHEHAFSPQETEVNVVSDLTGINFENTTKRLLSGAVRGGCDIVLGQGKLRVYNLDGPPAIDIELVTNASGVYEIELPARRYEMELIEFTPEAGLDVTEGDVLAFFGVTVVDLTDQPVQQNFIYRTAPVMEISGFPASGCAPFDVPIMEQLSTYPLEIVVTEGFGSSSCSATNGFVVVIDEIADHKGEPDTLMIGNGIVRYDVVAGVPNIFGTGPRPYQKRITFHVNVDGQTSDIETYVLVQGNKPREQTFTTVSPEIPYLILRDPPGDESSSFVSQNATLETSLSLYAQQSASTNAWSKVKLGLEQDLGVGVEIPFKLWGEVESKIEVGGSLKGQTDLKLEMKTESKISTADSESITGTEGDVFVGWAMNMLYAITDVVTFDAQACEVHTSEELIVAPDDFATTFMYTENHINELLIPQLKELMAIAAKNESDSVRFYRNQVNVWEQTLADNEQQKRDAIFLENRSFSGGVAFESSATMSVNAATSIEFSMYIEQTVATELGLEIGGSGASLGTETKLKLELGGSVAVGATTERTVGYTLKDGDQGDFFSVDIKADPVYATPVFALVSGRSSCPWEPGTQARQSAKLEIDKRVLYNVEQNAAAVFRLYLTNASQSNEAGTYNLTFLQESNPEAAIITLGGSEVQGGVPTPYNIPAGATVEALVTVRRGPEANGYQDLQFELMPTCGEGGSGDIISFSVFYKSNCSPVSLTKPANRWLVTENSASAVAVELSGYDKTRLNNIVLQYRNVNFNAWATAVALSASDLPPNKVNVEWKTGNVPDGDYELRAKVACGVNNNEYIFSPNSAGKIDRTPPAVFGVPAPTSGTYETGDEVSVEFSEPVNCFKLSSIEATCVDKNSGASIPLVTGCSNNKIVVVPLTEAALVNTALEISIDGVEDNYGNRMTQPVKWSFNVNDANFVETAATDSDGDGVVNIDDNCPYSANANQADVDDDGIGDACDDDIDGDGISNVFDNCPYSANPGQEDVNGNNIGDACELLNETDEDEDGDGVINELDNCPFAPNPDQLDTDNDNVGDVCDDDVDGDGVPNASDNCPTMANADQADRDNDGIGNVCDVITGVESEVNEAKLFQFYPNPSTGTINIVFQVEHPGAVVIGVLDIASRNVQPLLDEVMPAGRHERSFDLSALNDGFYVLQINRNGARQAQKLVIRK